MDSVLNFHFMRPLWLLALPLLGLLLWQLWRRRIEPASSWNKVMDPELLAALNEGSAATASRLPLWLLALAWLLTVLALAGPSWEKLPQPAYQKQDALVILLDLSPSMYAEDVEPSRLVRAQREIRDVLGLRSEGMTALIAYADDAHVVTPLTDDGETISLLLPSLEPGTMPSFGNQPLRALELAAELVANSPVESARALLVTDGIPAEDFAALEALAETASLQLSVLGIGTPAGAPIPLSRGGFLKDSSGAMVVARLNEDELQGWAQSAPVRYQRSSFSDRDIELLLRPGSSERVNPGVHAAQTRQQFDNWRDAGPWLALLLLPIALLAFRRGWLLGLVGVGLLLPSPPGYALSWSDLWFTDDQQGRALLREGNAEQAAETFRDPQWQGAARYRAGDYSGAAEAFAGDDSSSGHYNRGNALARNGELEQALEAYERALELDPGNEDAASNREQVEQLLQQQQQQPQQSGDEPNQDQGGDPNGNQDNSQRNPGEQQEQQGQQGDGEQQDSAGRPDSGDSNGLNDDPGEQDAEQADEQPGEQDPEQADEQPGEQDAAQGEPGNESGQAGQPEASEQAEANGEAEMGARASAEESERLQQWLRQIPDEPGDLLQRKFNYQYRQRQQAGDQNSRERY